MVILKEGLHLAMYRFGRKMAARTFSLVGATSGNLASPCLTNRRMHRHHFTYCRVKFSEMTVHWLKDVP